MSLRPRSLRARAALSAALGVAGILLVHGLYAAARPGPDSGPLLLLALLCLALATALALAHARHVSRPLQRLAASARALAEGRLDREIEVGDLEELRAVAERVNQMAARLRENIDQLEESNRQLAAANRRLKELDQTKSDLLANVSHELRTPLTAIKGYADYMLERKLGAITPSQERGLQVVQRNLERLSRTIDDLLDFSRLEADQVAVNSQPFSLDLLVDQVRQTLRSLAEKKRIELSADVPPDLPQVEADREKLGQVLENLVVNAIKFTPDGGVVTVSTRVDTGRGIEVSVRDTGIGIPVSQQARIFDRFHQADASSRRRFSGVGLGLTIVKGILDAHGVELQVESAPGKGSCFRFWLKAASGPSGTGADEGTHAL
jgi:signal transduction histidine kinase